MTLRRVAMTLFMALGLLAFGGVGMAGAHFLNEDSVDGNEIRYEDYTKWDDARSWGEARWEEIPGDVNIAPDSWSTATDLEIRDYNSNDGRCGYWDGRSGADLMRLNDYYFNSYGTTDRRACTLHEWGHAHRLAHSYNDQVMDDCPVSACGSVYTYPQAHDKADYDALW